MALLEKIEPITLAACLAIGSAAVAFLEPRTLPVEGYHADYHVAYWMLASILVFAVAAIRLPLNFAIRWWLMIPAAAALFFNTTIVWIAFLSITILSGTLEMASRKMTKLQVSSRPLATFGLLVGMLGFTNFVYEGVGIDWNLSAPLNAVLRFLLPTMVHASNNGLLVSTTDGRPELITMGADKAGGIFGFAFLVLTWVLGTLKGLSLRRRIVDLCFVFIYIVVAGYFRILSESGSLDENWYNELRLLITHLPLAIFIGWRLCQNTPQTEVKKRFQGKFALAFSAAATIGMLCLGFGYSFWGPSQTKVGKIAFDEFHSAWEPMDIQMNEELFGTLSVYNYTIFYNEVDRVFGAKKLTSELTDDDLKDVSVLVLKTPTKPYPLEFCKRVKHFVENGGGLWLIGDHTDAFGMTTYLNEIATQFGMRFEKNAYIEPPYKRNLWTPADYSDPIVANLSTFLMYTGCELSPAFLDKRLMVARRSFVETADYSAGSFFGELRAVPQNVSGNVTMSVAGQRGRGRIILWSDSTLFSNFAIDTPGKLPIAYSMIDWLRQSNSVPVLRETIFLAGVVFLLAACIGLGATEFVLVATIGVSLLPAFERLNYAHMRVWHQEDVLHDRVISYIEPAKSMHYAVYISIDQLGPEYYNSAFVAARRIGSQAFYRETTNLGPNDKVAVIVPEGRAFSDADVENLAKWTLSGGHLVILDSLRDLGLTTSKIFKACGYPVPFTGLSEQRLVDGIPTVGEVQEEPISDNNEKAIGSTPVGALVHPARTLIQTVANRKPVAGTYNIGRGKIFVSASTIAFSDQCLSDVHSVPTRSQRLLLAVLFKALKD